MNSGFRTTKVCLGLIICILSVSPWQLAGQQTRVLFQTGFEASEGYSPVSNLNGVNGWSSTSNGGSGIPDDSFFPNEGQQAFIGFAPFEDISEENFSLFLWNPVNFTPDGPEDSIVEFRVMFQIFDSTTGSRDDFRWSFFNRENKRLFTIDFDNSSLRINYLLGSSSDFILTRTPFVNDKPYQLRVVLNFQTNKWSAFLDEQLILAELPLVEDGIEASLSDVSIIWSVKDVAAPGDNFMVFDNYRVSVLSTRPSVEMFKEPDGTVVLRASSAIASTWQLQYSDNLTSWETLFDANLGPNPSEWEIDLSREAGFWRFVP